MSLERATRVFFLTVLTVLAASSTAWAQQVVITDDVTTDTRWTSDNEYFLDGLIFVDAGATLTIDAGTVIKGVESDFITTGDGASALIVRRGAKIMAEGTATEPIIFTSELDDVTDPTDLDQRSRGLWGGVIILGRATTNEPSESIQIEGIPAENEDATYGGTNDADDSGVLKYVSIRHGGFSISGVAGDEINGLTLGAVGSGTTIEHVEVFANFDDCYEWFGGTVNTKYLVGAFCGDDTFDYDQGFRGKGQYWLSIHDTDTAGRAGEHDGGDSAGDDATPFSTPVISNVTYIGSGRTAVVAGGDNNDRAFAIRDNAGGQYWNSIFTDFPGVAINIEDRGAGSSRERLETGDLAFVGNMFFGFGAGNTFAEIVDADFADNTIASTNEITDPMLAGICRTTDACLDPRPMAGSPALGGSQSVGDAFFDDVAFRGAFGSDLWIQGWTALDALGFLGELSTVAVEQVGDELPAGFSLQQNYPNPFNPTTTFEFALSRNEHVRLSVHELLGREVAVLVDGVQSPGTYRVSFDASGFSSGAYLYRMASPSGTVTRMMTLLK